jgi:nicotinamide mononucleotide adenylyltransferase
MESELLDLVNGADQVSIGILYPENLPPGMAALRFQQLSQLGARFKGPWNVHPLPARGMAAAYYAMRIFLLMPECETWFCDETYPALMDRIGYRPFRFSNYQHESASLVNVKSGLFIFRAQPYHKGSDTFIREMLETVDILYVIIGYGEFGFTPRDPMTATERLQQLIPYFFNEFGHRINLMALPGNQFTQENMLELELLLPPCTYLFTTNPITELMALHLGYTVHGIQASIPVSGSMLRTALLKGEEPREGLMYDAVPEFESFHKQMGLRERIQVLNRPEIR